jgi:hypothetical protein
VRGLLRESSAVPDRRRHSEQQRRAGVRLPGCAQRAQPCRVRHHRQPRAVGPVERCYGVHRTDVPHVHSVLRRHFCARPDRPCSGRSLVQSLRTRRFTLTKSRTAGCKSIRLGWLF